MNSASAASNDIWFTSRRQDAETGLVYMGARYYDPVAGRFISQDPKLFDEKNIHSFNRYAYANNNPYKYMDPDGKDAIFVVNEDKTVQVYLPITFSGPGANTEAIERIKEQVHSAWSGLFDGIGIDVRVIEGAMNNIMLVTEPTSAPCPGGRSCVVGTNTGVWNVADKDWALGIAAHEAGHLLGHGDKYSPIPDSIFTKALEGWSGNLMSELGGTIDVRNLREIIGSPHNIWTYANK